MPTELAQARTVKPHVLRQQAWGCLGAVSWVSREARDQGLGPAGVGAEGAVCLQVLHGGPGHAAAVYLLPGGQGSRGDGDHAVSRRDSHPAHLYPRGRVQLHPSLHPLACGSQGQYVYLLILGGHYCLMPFCPCPTVPGETHTLAGDVQLEEGARQSPLARLGRLPCHQGQPSSERSAGSAQTHPSLVSEGSQEQNCTSVLHCCAPHWGPHHTPKPHGAQLPAATSNRRLQPETHPRQASCLQGVESGRVDACPCLHLGLRGGPGWGQCPKAPPLLTQPQPCK